MTNFIALKGGSLKREQMLSGDMADIFSNLYLMLSVNYYENNYKVSQILKNYIEKKLLNENQIKINKIINNLGIEKYFLQHLKKNVKYSTYNEENLFFNEILNNQKIMDEIKKDIFIKNNILEDLEKIQLLNKNSKEYKALKDKIINVGEYDI